MPALLLLMGAIALLIKLDSPGSPFFVQERVGKDQRLFRLYKFRTMRSDYDDKADRVFMQAYVAGKLPNAEDADEDSGDRDALFKPIKKNDITRVGRFLRKASLDELPQAINILRGEMSLVGPRPNVPWEVASYQEWHLERLSVLPGITGLAQINGRSNISFDQIAKYDVLYVRNLSIKTDLQILWQTFRIVFIGRGAG